MELFYQACEVAATGSEVVMMLYFVSKFLGCRYQGWQNRIFQFLSFFVIFNYMMIVDKIFLPYNAVKDFVVMLFVYLVCAAFDKRRKALSDHIAGSRYHHDCRYQHFCT